MHLTREQHGRRSKRQRAARANRRSRRCDLERLENRELLTASLALVGNDLRIYADAAGDSVQVVQYYQFSPPQNYYGRGTVTEMLSVKSTVGNSVKSWQFPKYLVNQITFAGSNNRDTFENFTSVGCVAKGNGGNDLLRGGSTDDALYGGTGDDQLYGGSGSDFLYGNEHQDILFGEAGVDTLYGGNGNDFLDGGSENDHLFGEADSDDLYGGWGNDQLDGGDHNDYLYGYYGNDTLQGGMGDDLLMGEGDADRLEGGPQNDTLWGGDGDDYLSGEDGNDWLYGGDGHDSLRDGTGTDNMFGGAGNDSLLVNTDNSLDKAYGESGADRFLVRTGMSGPYDLTDLTTQDARVFFENGGAITVNFSCFKNPGSYAAGAWTTQDIDWVDAAFAELVRRTNNNSLVKTASGGEMTFVRHGALLSGTAADGWNGNGKIALTQSGFSNGRNTVLRNVLHEVGHNWDQEYDAYGWRALSGWTTSNPGTNAAYTRGTNQNQAWWYLTSAAFASLYARTDPDEDFAESFTQYFLQRAGQLNTAHMIPTKISFLDRMCARKTTA